MNEQEKNNRLWRKEKLFNKLDVNKKSSFLSTWWLEIAQSLKNANCVWELEYLDVISENQYEYWIEKLKQEPWSSFSFPETVIKKGNSYWVHEMLYSKYPSVLPLRYLPVLEQFSAGSKQHLDIFKAINAQLMLGNQSVFLFSIRMSPVIKINLFDLVGLKFEDIILAHEDIAIMAIDGSWLIFKSLEGEWVFGRYKSRFS